MSFLFLLCLTVACNSEKTSGETSTASAPLTADAVDLSQYLPDTLLNRFQGEMNTFMRQDSLTPPRQGAVLFVGSSSIRMWDSLQADMQPTPVINRGFGGSTLPEVLHYFDQLVVPYQPKAIVLYAGENDLAMDEAGITPEQVRETFEIFVNTVRARVPQTEHVFFVSIKPSVARWQLWPVMQEANRLIKEYAASREKVHFMDVASKMMEGSQVRKDIFLQDSLHMNRKGYALWTEVIRPALSEVY